MLSLRSLLSSLALSFSFFFCFSSFTVAGLEQARCPLSMNRCKQATRPYQPLGLTKSNFFFFYWPTVKRRRFFSCSRVILLTFLSCLPCVSEFALIILLYCRRFVQFHAIHYIRKSPLAQNQYRRKRPRSMRARARLLIDATVVQSNPPSHHPAHNSNNKYFVILRDRITDNKW